ncbi:MAG: OprD family outer membrane porin, partial [Pseudomonas putida]
MSLAMFRGATCGLLCGWLPVAGAGGFVDDSKLKLQLRNVYFNENFRDEQGMSARAAASAKSERVE